MGICLLVAGGWYGRESANAQVSDKRLSVSSRTLRRQWVDRQHSANAYVSVGAVGSVIKDLAPRWCVADRMLRMRGFPVRGNAYTVHPSDYAWNGKMARTGGSPVIGSRRVGW